MQRTPQLSREKPAGRSGSRPVGGAWEWPRQPSGKQRAELQSQHLPSDPQRTGTRSKPPSPGRESQAGQCGGSASCRGLGSTPARAGIPSCNGRSPEARAEPPRGQEPQGTGSQRPPRCCEVNLQELNQVPPENVRKSPSEFRQGDGKEVAVNSPAHPALNKACPQGTLVARASRTWAQGPPALAPLPSWLPTREGKDRNPCGGTDSSGAHPSQNKAPLPPHLPTPAPEAGLRPFLLPVRPVPSLKERDEASQHDVERAQAAAEPD